MSTEDNEVRALKRYMSDLQSAVNDLRKDVRDLMKTLTGDGISSPGFVSATNDRINQIETRLKSVEDEWKKKHKELNDTYDEEQRRRAEWEKEMTQKVYKILGVLSVLGVGGAIAF